jgi:hypothetical protein
VGQHGGSDRWQKQIAHLDQSAAQDHSVRIKDIRQAGHGHAKPMAKYGEGVRSGDIARPGPSCDPLHDRDIGSRYAADIIAPQCSA